MSCDGGSACRALCTGTGPRSTPAIRAGKGWRGRRESRLPGVLPPELGAYWCAFISNGQTRHASYTSGPQPPPQLPPSHSSIHHNTTTMGWPSCRGGGAQLPFLTQDVVAIRDRGRGVLLVKAVFRDTNKLKMKNILFVTVEDT